MNNVKVDVKNEIAYVTIDRPKALNALNSETLKELNETFSDIRDRKDVKVLILTGGGEKSFVAGADISEMVNATPQEGRAMSIALGGGCEISMACDIRVASKNALFGQPEVGLGIIPGFGGTQRLPRLVGKGIAKELIFTTDSIKADEAYRIGLVNHVVEKEELIDYCTKMAEKIISKASYAVTLAKQVINLGLESDLHTGIQLEANTFASTFETHDKKEGMTAFLEKRKADLSDF